MKASNKIIIIFGRSGSGKGTQAKLLLKEFGFNYISSGKLLRARAQEHDFTGRKLKEVLAKGELIPVPIMFRIWAEEVEKLRQEIDKQGLIIDGSPRYLLEAKLMDSAFEWYQWKEIKVILLDISEQEAFERLTNRRICEKCGRLIPWTGDFKGMKVCDKCGGQLVARDDDQPKAIRARLAYYKKDVQPAIDYYEKQGRLIKIDGERSIEDVYYDIKKAIL